MSSIMTIRRKWINYRVYAPDYEDGKGLGLSEDEKGIVILAPIVRRTNDNAKQDETDESSTAVGFRAAYVFESSPRVPLQKVPSIEASTSSLNSSALFNAPRCRGSSYRHLLSTTPGF